MGIEARVPNLDTTGPITSEKGLVLSEVGLGAYPFTEHWHSGGVDDSRAIGIIDSAIDNGVNVIDTCEMHGNGHTESVVGRAIEEKRDSVAIVTKGGFTQKPGGKWGDWIIDASPDNIHSAIDGSLRRLGTDYIDYYLSHFPDPNIPVEETLGALQEAKESGKILAFGLSNYNAGDIEEALATAPELKALQHHYSLLERGIEQDVMPISEREDSVLMVYRVLERGLLTGRFRRGDSSDDDVRDNYEMFQEPQLSEALKKVESLKEVAAKYGYTPSQVAIRWVLSHSGVKVALVGASSKDQLSETLKAADKDIDEEDLRRLDEVFA